MPALRHLLALIVLSLVLAACGEDESSDDAASTATTPAAAAENPCSKEKLDLLEPGALTVGTDKPAYPPYFEDDDPANGKGFESAVAYAIAEKLGFEQTEVKWTVVPFNSSYAPGPKKFDFDINQISISPARAKRVDFSAPYFTAPQAVVARAGTGAADAKTLQDLAGAKLGVQVGTTSLDAAMASIKPSAQPQVFNDSNDTVRALKSGRVDAVVVDLPTAFYLTAAQLDDGKIVGQFDAPGGDDWGVVLAKGSKLTPCVSKAIEGLRADGELDRIEAEWMGGEAAPELR